MRTLFLLLFIAPLLGSCGGCQSTTANNESQVEIEKTEPENGYFSGEYLYYADAATFKDCITGTTFSIRMEGDSKSVEEKFLQLNSDGKSVLCELYGRIVAKPKGEEGHDRQLVITKFIAFNVGAVCDPAMILTGSYQSINNSVLQLNGDYTYSLDGKSGEWGRTDAENLFLDNGTTVERGAIDFTNQEIRISNEVYNKVTAK